MSAEERSQTQRRDLESAERRRIDMESGRRLELLDSIFPEDRTAVLGVLEQIGDTIHARFGFERPTQPIYEASQRKYRLSLVSGTAGTRIFINESAPYPGDLIFPNVNSSHNKDGRTLADVFEELFGDLAENIQPNSTEPYYVVSLVEKK